MVERLPNIPVLAQKYWTKTGEIMEIKIPFGSSYAYKSIATLEQKIGEFLVFIEIKISRIKRSLVLKPNDIIPCNWKPSVLMNIYNVIGKTQGQFPMPFGNNIYLYLDTYLEDELSVKHILKRY